MGKLNLYFYVLEMKGDDWEKILAALLLDFKALASYGTLLKTTLQGG